MNCALRFNFKASNNEVKYEALIAGLKLAKEVKVESLDIFSDSQLVVCQVNEEYQAWEEKMVAYLYKTQELLKSFSSFMIRQIPRSQIVEADALTRLASARDTEQLKFIWVEIRNSPSIQIGEPSTVNCTTAGDN